MSSRKSLIALLCPVILLVGAAVAVAEDEGYDIISTSELHQWLKSEAKPMLIFSLSPLEFSEEHIPSSYCIPFEIMSNYYQMPEDTQRQMVFYCHGPG